MANDPAFLFYPGDYLRDTQTLSEKTQVSYDRIMCEHMRNICISKRQLKFFTKKLNEDEIEELMFVLTEVEGGFQITWVADSISKRKRYSESRRNNRKGKKKEDVKNISETYDSHMENENENENINEIEVKDEIEIKSKKIEFQKIIDIFNSVCKNLPEVQKITNQRKSAINARIQEYGLSKIGDVFQLVAKNEFLNGNNDRGWTADFDWIMNPNNFIKILEGKYNGKQSSNSVQGASDDFRAKTAKRLGLV